MKTRFDKTAAIFVLSFLMGTVGINDLFGQGKEYDDMYFSSKDRLFGKATAASSTSSIAAPQENAPKEYTYSEDSYSARTVNPEYIARYKEESKDIEQEEPLADTYSSQDYYVEDYQGENQNEPTVVNNYNNYYGPNGPSGQYSGYNPYYDPFYSPYSAYSYYSYYDPFYSPWGYSYDPWYYGGYRPYRPYGSALRVSISFGFGYGSYYCPSPYYVSNYYSSYYSGYYQGVNDVVYYSAAPTRTVVRGSRNSRSSVVNTRSTETAVRTSEGSTPTRRSRNGGDLGTSARVNEGQETMITTSSRGRTDNRDFESTQNEYLNRSRTRYSGKPTVTGNASSTSRSTAVNRSRERTTYRVPRQSSTSSVSTRTSDVRRSSNRSNSSYRPSSGSNQRSTYRNSRSNSPSRSNTSYTNPSRGRSSGYSSGRSSSRSSSYSRPSSSSSSGRSYSRPSSSPSRSSGSRSSSSSSRSRR